MEVILIELQLEVNNYFLFTRKGNAMKATFEGSNTVEFDDGTIITYTNPYIWLRYFYYKINCYKKWCTLGNKSI